MLVKKKEDYDLLVDLISESKKENISLTFKALHCLAALCDCRQVTEYLFSKQIVRKLKVITEQNHTELVSIVAFLITKLISAPEDMALWLKFDSDNLAVNSSNT